MYAPLQCAGKEKSHFIYSLHIKIYINKPNNTAYNDELENIYTKNKTLLAREHVEENKN